MERPWELLKENIFIGIWEVYNHRKKDRGGNWKLEDAILYIPGGYSSPP